MMSLPHVTLITATPRGGVTSPNPVILSERSEPKNPPKLRATMRRAACVRPEGDPSTRSSDSLAQGDIVFVIGSEARRAESNSLAPNDKGPCHPERSDLRGRVVEGSPEGWKTAPVGSSHRPSGDSSTHSRTRSLRMTGTGCSIIPAVGAAPRRGGAQGDMRGGLR